MEKLPKFEVIGNVPDEEKVKHLDHRMNVFLKQQDMAPEDIRKAIVEAEHDKTPEQSAIIDNINTETNKLMEECGITPFDISEKNYHILAKEDLRILFNTDAQATYSTRGQAIGISSEMCAIPLCFTAVALHEALHMKARQIAELYRGQDGRIKEKRFRGGVSAFSPHKKDEEGREVSHLTGINEAITAWQEKLSFARLSETPELISEKEKQETDSAKEFRQKISEKRGIPEDEIYYVNPLAKDKEESYLTFGYNVQRKVLEYVCEEIAQEFSDEYQVKEDVFRVFLKANLDGNLIPLARLMKRTFGNMGLRVLGMMKPDDSKNRTADNILEMLRKMRREVLRQEKK